MEADGEPAAGPEPPPRRWGASGLDGSKKRRGPGARRGWREAGDLVGELLEQAGAELEGGGALVHELVDLWGRGGAGPSTANRRERWGPGGGEKRGRESDRGHCCCSENIRATTAEGMTAMGLGGLCGYCGETERGGRGVAPRRATGGRQGTAAPGPGAPRTSGWRPFLWGGG